MKKLLLNLFAIVFLVTVAAAVWKKYSTTKYTIDVSRAAVITQLQTLNRYETTSFTIEKIIEARAGDDTGLNKILFGDKLLLIAHGEVIGGFDFSQLQDDAVQINNKTITLDLPAPQILTTRLDSEQTRVYDRTQGLLTNGDKDLETKARVAAEQSIRQAACQGGILKEASTKGRSQLEMILKTIGFETVIINIPEGSCN